jgi:hypothetical protein
VALVVDQFCGSVKRVSPVFPNEVSDQVSAMELSNHLDVFEYIRLALEVPARP